MTAKPYIIEAYLVNHSGAAGRNSKVKIMAYTAEDALTQFKVINQHNDVRIVEIFPFSELNQKGAPGHYETSKAE